MKFENYKLKTDQYGFKFAKEDIMLGNREYSCFTCHAPTKFIEINAEAPFCSDECVDTFYRMHNEVIEIMEEE